MKNKTNEMERISDYSQNSISKMKIWQRRKIKKSKLNQINNNYIDFRIQTRPEFGMNSFFPNPNSFLTNNKILKRKRFSQE